MTTRRQRVGNEGEAQASDFLKSQGFQILEKNILTKFGEIDLVARKNQQLYFVEIRKRVGQGFGSALDSITRQKQQKIRKTAQFLLQTRSAWRGLEPHLSVIAIDENDGQAPDIEFIPNAFE